MLLTVGVVNATEGTQNLLTNNRVLENSVDQLAISSLVKPVVRPGAAIVIRNIEAEKTTDKKIIALLEDQMVIDLVSNGFVVLERDSNAIRRAIEEGGRGNFSILRGDMELLDQTRNIDLAAKGQKDVVVLVKDPAIAEDDKKHLLLTHLKSADYILSYRVQELGINYEELDTKSVKRSSITRLHVRIEDVATGKIVLAKNIESSVLDSIPTNMIKTLAENRRSQFYQSYPFQNPDEDSRYVLSDKHLYVQAALLNNFTDQMGGIGLKTPFQIGVIYGDERLAYETFNGETEHRGATTTAMAHSMGVLAYGRKVGQVTLGVLKSNVVAELGVGNGSLTNWDSAKGAVTKKGLGIKAGIGLETQIYPQFDVAAAINFYTVDGNTLDVESLSLRYRF